MSRLSYKKRLEILGAHSLEFRRKIYDYVYIYKLTTEESDLELFDIFEKQPLMDVTRGHPFRIIPDVPTSSAYAGSFLVRTVGEWNKFDAKFFRWKRSCSFQEHIIDYFQRRLL